MPSPCWPIDPFGGVYFFWLTTISGCVVYNLFSIPLRMAFAQVNSPWWLLADYSCDLAFWIDMGVNFVLIVPRLGIPDQDLKYSRATYVKSTVFILDIVSILPTDLVYAVYSSQNVVVGCRLNRWCKAHRVLEWFERNASHSSYPTAFRFLRILMYIVILIHCTACAYYAINEYIGFGFDQWGIQNYGNSSESNFINLYTRSFYWATVILSDEGDNSRSYSLVIQLVFRCFFTLIGHILVGTTIAFVANIFATVSVTESRFRSQLDGIKKYMEFRQVAPEMQERLFNWAAYMLEGKKFLDNEHDLDMLPKPLRRTIAKAAHLDTFQRVKLFDDCEPQFLEELIMRLEMQVFSPGDLICRKGDVGHEMYCKTPLEPDDLIDQAELLEARSVIKQHGVVSDEGQIFATLGQGSVFGEISLLSIFTKQKNRRTANVQSASYSELFSLSGSDFKEVLESFPLARAKMIAKSRELLKDQSVSEVHKDLEDEDDVSVRINRLQDLSGDIVLLIETFMKTIISDTVRSKRRLDALERHHEIRRKSAAFAQ